MIHNTYIDLEQEIEHIEHRIHKFEAKLISNPSYFAGVAFISFNTEAEKREVLKENPYSNWETFKSFFN